ncbi:RDD family protein [Saccharospirillum impatiens]|uniref:RDD family protein n=1 Tax=Saccharospirillum impatiens TaxID=169438 RepID=UPI000405B1C5|nr:RDD family protein [Saccharospirillum impatiens]
MLASPNWLSSLSRRIGALVIDAAVLVSVGFVLGWVFESYFVELSVWARAIGFVIALLYFGLLNSELNDGQTIGKRLLAIRVVNVRNESIKLDVALLRSLILIAPFFIQGSGLPNALLHSFWIYPVSLMLFGGLVSIFYLMVFNRGTRQGPHDWICRTFVVNLESDPQRPEPIWLGHAVMVGFVLVLSLALPAAVQQSNIAEPQPDLDRSAAQLMQLDLVNHVQIARVDSERGDIENRFTSAQIMLTENRVDDEALAQTIASQLLQGNDRIRTQGPLMINLTYGFDLGIFSSWDSQMHRFNAPEL